MSWRSPGRGCRIRTRLALSSYELWRDIHCDECGGDRSRVVGLIQKLDYIRQNLRTRQLQEEFERAGRLAGRVRGSE